LIASEIAITCALPLADTDVALALLVGTDAARYLHLVAATALSMVNTTVTPPAAGGVVVVLIHEDDEATTTANAVLLGVDAALPLLHARIQTFLPRVPSI
jgi:uncharacterized YccA/Bax inhibitor family protein